jgi:hypothetical protein
VVFEVESIDRMHLNVWVPRLTYGGEVSGFFVGHRDHYYASTALTDPITKAFVADIHGFVATRGLELVGFISRRLPPLNDVVPATLVFLPAPRSDNDEASSRIHGHSPHPAFPSPVAPGRNGDPWTYP